MEFDPSLNGLSGAVELAGDLGNGTTLLENLFDGGALKGKGITRLFFRHRGMMFPIRRHSHRRPQTSPVPA